MTNDDLRDPDADPEAESEYDSESENDVEVTVQRAGLGWTIRVPVRSEAVTFEKRAVVTERVVVRRTEVIEAERIAAEVQRERLRLKEDAQGRLRYARRDTLDDMQSTRPIPTQPRQHRDGILGATGMEQDPLD